MKKVLLVLALVAGFAATAQSKSDDFKSRKVRYESVSYEDTKTFSTYSKMKNGRIGKYVTQRGEMISVGDTIKLGLPGGGGDHLRGGNNNNSAAERKFNASATSMVYSQIVAGDPYNGGRIALKIAMAAAGVDNPAAYQEGPLEGNFKGELFIVKRMRLYRHKGGKKKQPYIGIAIQPLNGALGINKNAFIKDYESAFEIGELIDLEATMTKDEARAILRLAKEDFDLGIIDQAEFDVMKANVQKELKKNKK